VTPTDLRQSAYLAIADIGRLGSERLPNQNNMQIGACRGVGNPIVSRGDDNIDSTPSVTIPNQ